MTTPGNDLFSAATRVAATLAFATLVIACSSPTAPQSDPPVQAAQASLAISGAQVLFNGQVVNGQTMHAGQMNGGNTLFRATLTHQNGSPAPGQTVQVHYQFPGNGMGSMMGGDGILHLYDDGTHGDPIAGDGIYCLEDGAGQYGMHGQHGQHGEYHYEFYGFDQQDHHSNHVMVWVNITE